MNNIKNTKKLSLKKETIVALNAKQMNQVKGGTAHTSRSLGIVCRRQRTMPF